MVVARELGRLLGSVVVVELALNSREALSGPGHNVNRYVMLERGSPRLGLTSSSASSKRLTRFWMATGASAVC